LTCRTPIGCALRRLRHRRAPRLHSPRGRALKDARRTRSGRGAPAPAAPHQAAAVDPRSVLASRFRRRPTNIAEGLFGRFGYICTAFFDHSRLNSSRFRVDFQVISLTNSCGALEKRSLRNIHARSYGYWRGGASSRGRLAGRHSMECGREVAARCALSRMLGSRACRGKCPEYRQDDARLFPRRRVG